MDKGVYVILQLMSFLLHYFSSLFDPNGSHSNLSCPSPTTEPLMLTSYILSNQTERAQDLSRTTASCFEDFVPASHSGFITVNEKLGNHLFFWYFPSPTNSSAPLLVWLNGGPGVSSMQGLLYQNGPLKLEPSTKDTTNVKYSQRKHSFVGPFSVVYIDNPVGTGYSFSDSGSRGYPKSQEEYGEDLFQFMKQFVELFSQYQEENDIYIGGQSYAGKYIPAMGKFIHESNISGKTKINLSGIYLAGPLFDPETNFEHIHDFYFSLGVISHKMLVDQKKKARDEFKLFKTGLLANDSLKKIWETAMPVRLPLRKSHENYVTGKSFDKDAMNALMLSRKFRSALHVGAKTTYLAMNRNYINTMAEDIRRSSKEKLALLMDNYKVLIYNGDYDVITNTNTIEAGLLVTKWKGRKDYENALRSPWIRGDGKILGYYTGVGQFCRVVVHGAGHQVGMDQEESNLLLMEQFARQGCVS